MRHMGYSHPSMTSGIQGIRTAVQVRKRVVVHTHVEPFCTSLNHALTFCGQLAKVRGKNGGRDDRSRHGSWSKMKRLDGD